MKTLRIMGIALVLAALLLVNVPAMSGMADTFTATRTLPAANLHPGDTFDVTVTFTAPENGFIPGFTDTAPGGWTASADAAWCSPSGAISNTPAPGTVEYIWLSSFSSGQFFSIMYRITVPAGAADGTYSFPGGQIEYYISGAGPYTVAITGNTQVHVVSPHVLTMAVNGSGTTSPAVGAHTYDGGTVVNISATASTGYHFTSWTGDVASPTSPSTTVTVNADKTVTANFVQNEYTLTINTVGNGSVVKNPDKTTYHYGDVVQLSAVADANWTFGTWSGDLSGSASPANLTIDGNKTVTATFTQNEYTLTVNIAGSGSVTRNPDQSTYHYGDVVQLTASATTGWTFSGWSGDLSGSASPTSITIDGNKTVTATFTQNGYTLTVNIVGNGTVTRNPDSAVYQYGDVVQLTASAATGWTFSGWSGGISGSTSPASIAIDGNKTVTATFTQNEYTLTVYVVGNGTVTKNPDQSTYHYGDVVQLTVTPAIGWTFTAWSGDLSGFASPRAIVMNGNKTVTATLTQIEYNLTINTEGGGTVTKNPDKTTYHYGDVVQVTAVPDAGWSFDHWSGNLSGSANPNSITINGNKTVTATFIQNEYTLTVVVVGSGTVIKSPNQATYHYGDVVQLTASPSTGWSFSAWSVDLSGSVNPSNITINGNKAVTATFIQNAYTLTVSDDGHGSTSKDPDQASYHDGDVVTINATPDTGYHFVNWIGDTANVANVNNASTTVTMHGNYVITANFAPNEYTLTINTVGSGSVIKSPNQATYHYGDTVQLTASPATGWSFSVWSGDLSGLVNPSNITINGNKTVTATFIQNEYTLVVNIVGNGSVDIDITGPYHYGDIVELTAVPDTGWTFSAWSSDLTGSTNPANITIDGDMSVTATFTQVITGGSIGGVGGSPGITNLTGYMNDGGEFLVDASAESDDGLVKITFPQGTIFLTSNGQPGHFIFIKKQDTPPAPPDNAAFICFTYDISPNGSTFTPYAYLTFFYNDSMVPEGVAEENLVIVTWQDGEWVPLEGCVVDTVNNTITVPLTHLTMFTVIAHTSPASFVASEMTITPAEVHPGEDITVNVTISNIGDLADNYQAVLKVSGMSDRVKTVTLNGGESQTVSFTVTPAGAGSYTVQIGGLTGGFTVKEPEGTVAEVPTPEVPKPSSTPTETEPAIPNPVTPTPAETPESPGETQTTQSGGLSWQFITVYAAGAALLVGSALTFVLSRRRSKK